MEKEAVTKQGGIVGQISTCLKGKMLTADQFKAIYCELVQHRKIGPIETKEVINGQ
jgi:hypothetical protein